ncbi:AAA family ATPase [Actinomycetospora endophytica]|uniref:AAA family ATPase n=1 Tax=Actinomycetospora endophytica TaxID=2291215 RepID=A0ABS8P1J1_9PSEU|nr:BTAD domain-containing putative transcriptional regulator [Actinomycetospora endophytica]MCD2192111.1 AAA family ATPase [Actinomycetospora endophytica]
MEFRVLGPLEAVDDQGRPAELGGARERALLAVLLLAPDAVVPAARLAGELWGERMPEGWPHALRVHVSRLRRALRASDADGLLVTRAPGYLLAVDADAVDARRFCGLVARGRAESASDPATAARTFRAALDLWRGPLLGDALDSPVIRSEAARLEEDRLGALEERIEADLACGRHGELVGELDGLVRAHPVRERLRAQQMTALYRSGRQVDALRAYDDLRHHLGEELGIDPSAALVRLHAAVLRQDPTLDPGLPSDAPVTIRAQTAARAAPVAPAAALLAERGGDFVGRGGELSRLESVWDAAGALGARLVLLAGEPGVGKTRLAAELAERAAREAPVLAGRCDEDLGVPYQPFVEALRDQVARGTPELLRTALGSRPGELARLVPEIAELLGDLDPPLRADPETERHRLFEAVASWLAAAGEGSRVLLLLDDLHWAARPTLQLLRHVTRSPLTTGLVVVATYRDTETGRGHPLTALLADLRRQPGVERMHLDGLGESAVAELLHGAAPEDSPVDAALARAIHAETEGVPFFVLEVLRHLTETGSLRSPDARLHLEAVGLPDGVREVMGRRLSRLAEATVEVLRIAAVVGPEFDPAVVRAAGGHDEDTVLDALEEAGEARLIVEVGDRAPRYRFAHALVRATVLDALTAARLASWHRRIAAAIEEQQPTVGTDQLAALAAHWSRAGGGAAERGKARAYAVAAGERAAAQLAHDEAVTWLRLAVDLLDAGDDPARVGLLIALGEAQRRAGDVAHRQTLLAAAGHARTLGDTEGLARAAIANSPGSKPSVFGITDRERVAVLEAAVDAVGPTDSPTRARLLAVLALELFHTGDRARRLFLSDAALAIARRLGDPEVLADVLVARPFAIGGPDTLATRLSETGELVELARRLGDPVAVHRAWWTRFRVAVEVGDAAEADRCLDAEEELLAEVGQPTLEWMTGLQRVARALRRGDPEAEVLLERVAAAGRATGQPDARLYHAIQLFQLRRDQGRVADAEEVVRQVVAGSPELPSIHAALAVLCAESGRPDEAGALVEALAPPDLGDLTVEASTMVTWVLCADVAVHLGDRRRAEQLARVLAPYPEQIAVWAVGLGVGSVASRLGRLAGLLGDAGLARAHRERALEIEERAQAPTWIARTRADWA